MEKINFQNGITPLNDTNLNQMQTNTENAINKVQTNMENAINEAQTNLETAINNKQDKITEGTWTPEINTLENAKPTIEYQFRKGVYKKIGKLVYISFFARGKITALNGAYNYATISGLPFYSGAGAGQNSINIGTIYDLTNETNNMGMFVMDQIIRIQCNYGAGAATLKVTPGSYFDIAGSGWYEIT